jgi:uncharacterized protein YecT (DUF1311 family)
VKPTHPQAAWLIRDASGEHSWQADDTEAKLRRLLIACALALTACAAPQAHADPLPADPELVRACVGQAGRNCAALQQCQGVVTRACIEAQGGSNSLSDVLCRSAEADIWQTLIDENTARISAADAVDGRLLAAANASWTQWRDSECEYRAYEYGGGSGEQYDRIVCHLELTAARAIDLIVN